MTNILYRYYQACDSLIQLQNIRRYQDGWRNESKWKKSGSKRAALAFGVWYGQHRVHEAQIDKAVADVGASAETKRQHEILKTKAEIDKAVLKLVNIAAFRGDTKDGEHAKRQLVYLICGPHPAPENRAYYEANFPGGVPPPSYLLGK